MRAGSDLDLVILVPGRDERETLDGLLTSRRASLGIRELNHAFVTAPMRDPGCFPSAQSILRPFCNRASHALVLFDHHGSGQHLRESSEVEADVRARLAGNGWDDRAEVVVVEPELEAWVWTPSPVVDEVLGWRGRNPPLRHWLKDRGDWPDHLDKPPQPKSAVKAALHEGRIPFSSRLYRSLAERSSLAHCRDRSFQRLSALLRKWFPAE